MLANQPQWFIKLRTASSICINNEVDRQRHLQLTADVDHAAQGKSGRGSWLMVVVVMLWCSLTAVVLHAGQGKPGLCIWLTAIAVVLLNSNCAACRSQQVSARQLADGGNCHAAVRWRRSHAGPFDQAASFSCHLAAVRFRQVLLCKAYYLV